MNLFQAFGYFLREAGINLVRGWKVSLLAILTIGVSLFVSGIFLLLSTNLSSLAERWRSEALITVYLDPRAEDADRASLGELLRRPAWVTEVREVSPEEASERFRDLFPSLGDLVEGWSEDPLPASLEVLYDPDGLDPASFETWMGALRRSSPAASMVDDDREWLSRLEDAGRLVNTAGMGLGAALLVAAAFTIASVIRLTALLYREEIGVMRLVGATEFFLRGPFYTEGLIQGLLGGLLAVGALYASFLSLVARASVFAAPLAGGEFLSWRQMALLTLLGGFAGLAGAVLSLRREALAPPTGGS